MKIVAIRSIFMTLLLAAQVAVADPTTKPSMAELIGQLGADDFKTRQAAEDALVGLGTIVLSEVRTAIPKTIDPEANDRLRSIIQRVQADQEINATLVTLPATGNTVLQVYEALAKAVGLTIDVETKTLEKSLATQQSNIHFEQTPWLTALDQLCTQTGHSVRMEAGKLIVFDKPFPAGAPWKLVDAIMYRAESISLISTRELSSKRDTSLTVVSVNILAEPKLKFRRLPTFLINKAVDDHGQNLLTGQRDSGYARSFQMRDGLWTFPVRLDGVDPKAGKISILEGTIIGSIIVENTEVKEDHLPQIANKSISMMTGQITVGELSKKDGFYELPISCVSDNSVLVRTINAQESQISEFMALADPSTLQVTDADGNAFTSAFSAQRFDGQTRTATIRLTPSTRNPNAAPAHLKWTIPKRTRDYRLNVQINDLPIP